VRKAKEDFVVSKEIVYVRFKIIILIIMGENNKKKGKI
jgi:hypothetical protein